MHTTTRDTHDAPAIIHLIHESIDPAKTLPWNEHAAFRGVYLKHLITGTETNRRFSTHLVRIDPGREIGSHSHRAQIELHEIISGRGNCFLEGRTLAYHNGVVGLIPEDTDHRVVAGDEGLLFLATFVPALI